MKIAVVGGGSTYSPELVHGLAERAEKLGVERVALYDNDPARLGIVGGFVERMCRRIAPALEIERCGLLDEALSEASFVVVQIRVGGNAARLEDEKMGLRFGVVGQETTGVGGFAKALRTIPALLHIAERASLVSSNALLINFTNPVSVVTQALLEHAKIRSIGLCNIPISQRMDIAKTLRVRPDEVEIDSVGLNHLSFIRAVRARGEDVALTKLAEIEEFPAELVEQLGMIPSGYLKYFFYRNETIEEQRARKQQRAEEVMEIERELLAYYGDEKNAEKPASLEKRGGAFYSHAALEIIEAVALDRDARLIVDVQNRGAVRELPDNACVELPCIVDAGGATPLPQPALEPVIRGLIQHVKSYEELAVRAAISRSRRDVYLALVAHPLTPSAAIAGQIADVLVQRLGW